MSSFLWHQYLPRTWLSAIPLRKRKVSERLPACLRKLGRPSERNQGQNHNLRRGNPQIFFAGNNTYPYDTYDAYNDRRARRWTNAPVFLTKTNKGCGVVVSYITENTDYPLHDFPGKLIMFHFPEELTEPTEIIHNDDTDVYVRIKDIKSSDSSLGKSFMAVLLEDSYGKSVVRFPRVGTGALFNTTMSNQKRSLPCISHAVSLEVN